MATRTSLPASLRHGLRAVRKFSAQPAVASRFAAMQQQVRAAAVQPEAVPQKIDPVLETNGALAIAAAMDDSRWVCVPVCASQCRPAPPNARPSPLALPLPPSFVT